jgi:hypothetical protein
LDGRNARPIEKAFGDPVVARGVAFGIFPRGNLRHVYNDFEPSPPCRVREIRRCRKEADYQTRYSYFPATPKPIISADARSERNSRETPSHVKVFGFLYDIETTAIGRSQPMTALRHSQTSSFCTGREGSHGLSAFLHDVHWSAQLTDRISGWSDLMSGKNQRRVSR